MKRIITALILFPLFSWAQLHVSPNSYVYNNDQLLFVKNGVSLANNGNVYLRNEGQLLQGNSSTSTNSGLGVLSTFQEGTTNNFQYNYWCSPVGLPAAAAGNSPFGITLLNRPTTNIVSAPATILANTAFDGTASPFAIAPRWIFKFLSSDSYAQWIPVYNASTILAGEGFTMKGTSGIDGTTVLGVQNNPGSKQRYDFRGKPNSGDITITVANNQMTLTGNPYPSAIDLTAFLTAATNTTGIAYFWEHDKSVNSHLLANYRGGYGTFSPVSRGGTGIYVPASFSAYDAAGNPVPGPPVSGGNYGRLFSPIGQGFLVEGNALGTTAIMKDSYRVYQKENATTSVFERGLSASPENPFLPAIQSVSGFDYTTVSTLPTPQIRFNALLNNEAIRQTVLAFDSQATDGVDHAMDARNPDVNLPFDSYFVLDNDRYVISVTTFDENKRLPIGLCATSPSNFKFQVMEFLNFNPNQTVYIFDKNTGIYHNIVDEVFEANIPQGTFNDRFEITFNQNALAVNSNNANTFDVHQNNENQLLNVLNPNMIDIYEIALYDIAGKQIFKNNAVEAKNKHQIDTSRLSEGIYIVKIKSTSNTDFAQKIIVNRS